MYANQITPVEVIASNERLMLMARRISSFQPCWPNHARAIPRIAVTIDIGESLIRLPAMRSPWASIDQMLGKPEDSAISAVSCLTIIT